MTAIFLCCAPFVAAQSPIRRMPDGKPDFSGVWEHPPVLDVTKDGKNQKGAGELSYTEWAKAHLVEDVDSAAHCLPLGYVRNLGTPFVMEIVQRPARLVFLHEFNNEFHVVFMDGRGHPSDLEPTWGGHSIGKWDGDTLVIDTTGFNEKTRLDVVGHPHTDAMRVMERYTLVDADHIAYEIAIDDPKAYTKALKNTRTFVRHPGWEVSEYSCNENNKDILEGHVK
ncbi:MAG: hypothetical protein ABL995_14520 [Bryobacteraceae bacterium]